MLTPGGLRGCFVLLSEQSSVTCLPNRERIALRVGWAQFRMIYLDNSKWVGLVSAVFENFSVSKNIQITFAP
jgi:hypothetical protein